MAKRSLKKVAEPVEFELIRICARSTLSSADEEKLQIILRQNLDWSQVLTIAQKNSVLSLLYWHLKGRKLEGVPPSVFHYLKQTFHFDALRNDILCNELIRLLSIFESNGLAAIPFKGPVLAAMVYKNVLLRQFCDLDILVHEQDVQQAIEVLVADQYKPMKIMNKKEADHLFRHFHAFTLRRIDGRVDVDLHWRFSPAWASTSVNFDLASLESRLRVSDFKGCPILAIPAEEMLLVLCLHGGKELWRNLRMVCDVAELVRTHRDLDWERVFQLAAALRIVRMTKLGLLLAHTLLDAPINKSIIEFCSHDAVVQKVADRVPARLFSADPEVVNSFERKRLRPLLIDGYRDRLSSIIYVVGRMLTPTDQDRAVFRLTPGFHWVHYLLRPLRLIFDYGQTIFRYLRRDKTKVK